MRLLSVLQPMFLRENAAVIGDRCLKDRNVIAWGIDSEALGVGLDLETKDIHSIQVCSSDGENTGHAFRTAKEFCDWKQKLRGNKRPKIFYAFSLPFEYGTLAAWELLNASGEMGEVPWKHSWQHWLDEPRNLFYIRPPPARKRITVYDTRGLFHQLSSDKEQLTSLEKLGTYLSKVYNVDAHKLPHPLGPDFGKRGPTPEEWPEFAKYGIRDAYITALAGRWLEENVIQKWLDGSVPIRKILSWGTVARVYLELPEIGWVKYREPGGKPVIDFPTEWHFRILKETTAGRADALMTGNCGQLFYNDVTSLYPVSVIHSQAMLIRNLEDWGGGDKSRLLGPVNWEKFYEVTGSPYGWILGDFRTNDDLWGLPIRREDQNWFCVGDNFDGFLYHTLALEAANAEATRISRILLPVFADKNTLDGKKHFASAWRFEDLTSKKLEGKYEDDVEKHCIKSTINSATGTLGQSKYGIAETTNPLAYNTLLAESHLIMSTTFHQHHSEAHPICYCDTDSFFCDQPVEKTLGFLEPYPTLPYQIDNPLPLSVGVKGKSRPEGCIIFRGKMYYQSAENRAFSAWKPHPKTFTEIVEGKLRECDVERQVTRKWLTRDKRATTLKVGRWFYVKEHWDLEKLKQIFRADGKRCRISRDSYQLFLDDKCQWSRAWTRDEAAIRKRPEITEEEEDE